ncbi:nucleotide kinase domain-containing protein [Mesorhizobium sp.]|uniref:nucleotide kinase domain-containing protein n=1 Tax=Mesorhizobium sp. TaxID=1871066 RepID=UPI000FE64C46|nr:nucleotide kinase domain-containing protein [Mesorhizobium sp.]RWM45552.1 MAG: hypothetical protein EOR76_21220 [Mesorhizobium sp.]RWM58125.1 MAG: hypothetical protein EOR79_13960 [Mesorhizobium sp.]RWM58708.1 MAG: hypothetical protein EOR78_06315 [Mesorhizobium sp.]TIO65288.1 MAG: hypothetical protein E5X85_29375 [Mesorhizobium sp.]TJV85716.1 MAG: hypothetical protein E5X84_31980 [Mesorhizobium sp.]
MKTTVVYDSYWSFAAERLSMFYRRLTDPLGPWTDDPILRAFRFTNAYRAADRVSQYLISEVQYRADRSQTPREVFFRTILFKIFNKIETWEALERAHGPLTWDSVDLNKVDQTLTELHAKGRRIYSGAYIMPAPAFGKTRKHSNHIALLATMMTDRLPDRLRQAPDLKTVYESILRYPGLGRFLAFQYAIDLNYSSMLDFDEDNFVIAGPGALDGISKCFRNTDGRSAEAIIHWVAENQTEEFAKRGLVFTGLFGRALQPIDCQNLFCEISKYSRVAHPDVRGVADRTRIKQTYRPLSAALARPSFPPRWGLSIEDNAAVRPESAFARQLVLI